MARIACFTEHLPPDEDPISRFSFDLILGLADQGHTIRVYSTYRQEAELPSHPQIEILRPFKSWSWLEVPRLMPLLLDFQPEVFHLVQPRLEALKGLTNAMTALSGLAHFFGPAAVVLSLYDVMARDLKSYRSLLLTSDAITVTNEPQRQLVEKFLAAHRPARRTQLTTLPISSARSDLAFDDGGPMPEALQSLLDSGRQVIFVAGDISEHREPRQLFLALSSCLRSDPRAVVVFGGGWGRLPPRIRHELMRLFEGAGVGARVLIAGPLDPASERAYLSRARVVFLASLALESLGLTRILRQSLGVSAPLMMSRSQAKADPLNWRHGENALIIDDSAADWTTALESVLHSDDLLEKIRSQLPEFSRLEALDLPGNVVSRIYAEVISSAAGRRATAPQNRRANRWF